MSTSLGPTDAGDSNQAPEKVIHLPTQGEVTKLNEAFNKMGISGVTKGILLLGEKIFDEYWVSQYTRNWFKQFQYDMEHREACQDEVELKIWDIIIELDYAALMLCLRDDVTREKVKTITGRR